MKKRGVPLAANQVNYSLIYRTPELNGVKAACDELGITLIAYSPIAQGENHFSLFSVLIASSYLVLFTIQSHSFLYIFLAGTAKGLGR
jgi:diketogulonate reductase-like aldo/keto reductase